jgi:hypothetical protein
VTSRGLFGVATGPGFPCRGSGGYPPDARRMRTRPGDVDCVAPRGGSRRASLAPALVAQRPRPGTHGAHPRGRRKAVPARSAVRAAARMAREGAPRVVPRVASDAAVVIGAGLACLLGLAAGGPPDEQSDEDHQGHFEGEDQPDRRVQRTGNPRALRRGAQIVTARRCPRSRTACIGDVFEPAHRRERWGRWPQALRVTRLRRRARAAASSASASAAGDSGRRMVALRQLRLGSLPSRAAVG